MHNPILFVFVGKNGAKTLFVITSDAKSISRLSAAAGLLQIRARTSTGSPWKLRYFLFPHMECAGIVFALHSAFFISMSKCDEVTCVFCEICPPRCPHIVNFSRDTKNLRQVLPIPNFIRMLTEVLQFEERSQSVRNIAGSVPQLWYRHGPKVARPHGQNFAVLPKEGRPIVRIVRNSQNCILLRPALRCISRHSAYIFIGINNFDEIE